MTRRPRTDPTAASAPPAKRPRDSEGSHQLKVGRKRHTTVPSRAFYTARRQPGAERYGGPASNPKTEALNEILGCAHAHGCCESSEAELARRELLELITAPDVDVGGAIKLFLRSLAPLLPVARLSQEKANDSGEDASARVLFHRAAQAGSPLLLAGAPLPPDVGAGA